MSGAFVNAPCLVSKSLSSLRLQLNVLSSADMISPLKSVLPFNAFYQLRSVRDLQHH